MNFNAALYNIENMKLKNPMRERTSFLNTRPKFDALRVYYSKMFPLKLYFDQ